MLRTLRKFLVRSLALASLLLALLWWRSYRHTDLAQFDWTSMSDQCVQLISRNGALHLDHTLLHPLNTLKHAGTLEFAIKDDVVLSPEQLICTVNSVFQSRSEFQLKTPLQELYEDEAKQLPIYLTQTVPLRIVSVPFRWLLFLTLPAPAITIVRRLRFGKSKEPREASRLLWLLRHPVLCGVIATATLSLAWAATGWRTERFQLRPIHLSVVSQGGAVLITNTNAAGNWHQSTIDSLASFVHGSAYLPFDWIVAPIQLAIGETSSLAVPYWLLVAVTTSFVASLIVYRRTAPTFEAGHCQRCGYDLRASADRCPECGLIASAHAPPRRRRRITVAVMLWFGFAALLAHVSLGIGWIRSNAHAITLLEIQVPTRVLTVIEQSRIEGESRWASSGGGQIKFLDLPTWMFPAALLIASFGCFWIARSAARPSCHSDQLDATELTAAASP